MSKEKVHKESGIELEWMELHQAARIGNRTEKTINSVKVPNSHIIYSPKAIFIYVGDDKPFILPHTSMSVGQLK